jgi:myo-inositol-1(or 4)-monophosphatase
MTPERNCSIEELSLFADAAIRAAGEEALRFYGQGDANVKFDEELVTKAEIHLSGFFRERVTRQFPEHLVFLSDRLEEGYSHGQNRYLWIFDPLDGVDNFQTGIPVWGMSLAVLDNYWPLFGMVYLPSSRDMFRAHAGERAFHGDRAMRVLETEGVDDESILMIYSRFHRDYHSSFPGKIRNLGCTCAHMCYVAMGRADAAVVSNENYQNLAAAHVIVEAAGGGIYRLDGSRCQLNEYLDGSRIDGCLLVTSGGKLDAVKDLLLPVG